ncbi:hypothetical protein FB45DRAFT_981788 [Roridomyces roridus]|uniref:DUF3533 domain-containing protein n=1 Tax=Roridomyces roridus TaxID=1738132 RepID=A0AAD7B8D6_9AGAR|nr:hypothetical protein FB45DRAFT_981788 [Roridomyces roridus]
MGFFDKTPSAAISRTIYFKVLIGAVLGFTLVIFCICSIYWGAMWTTPTHTLPGWIVDFDGGFVGRDVSQAMNAIAPEHGGVRWEVVPASQFPGGLAQFEHAITSEKTWYGLSINSGASANLTAAIQSTDGAYDGSTALTFLGSQARNENIYPIHLGIITSQLEIVCQSLALQVAKNVSALASAGQLLSSAPQIVTRPVGYTIANLRPFDAPVASAVTFVGLIYLLILSFFIVIGATTARQISGLENKLRLSSLIKLRLTTAFIGYLWISLCYTLLSRAFQLPFDRQFGRAGFVVFWMLNYTGMLACGLAIDAIITLITIRFIPFFLITWIITNVSVCVWPIEVMPHVFKYGYAWPFYNIQRALRCIVFRTKNEVGMNFGIVIAWIALSCITLPVFQWYMRRKAVREMEAKAAKEAEEKREGHLRA